MSFLVEWLKVNKLEAMGTVLEVRHVKDTEASDTLNSRYFQYDMIN